MATRDELLVALAARYRDSGRAEKTRILDEFASVTGHHRKHAMRLLRAGPPGLASASRPERRVYDAAVREALIVLWEASDRICGKRLKAMIPTLLPAMARHGHLDLDPEIVAALLAISAATIDRALAPHIRAYRGIADRVRAIRHRLPRELARVRSAMEQHHRIIDLAVTGRLPEAESHLATHVRVVETLAIKLLIQQAQTTRRRRRRSDTAEQT